MSPMVNAISSNAGHSAVAAAQTQRSSATLDSQLAQFQQKLSDVSSREVSGGTPQAKVQMTQLSGQISGIRQRLSSAHVSSSVEAARPASTAHSTYASNGVVKSSGTGSVLDVVA